MAHGVTNRISFEEASDLVGSARACVSFVVDGAPHVEPAVVNRRGDAFLVGFDAAGATDVSNVGEVVLVIDDGVLFFDLRAILVRGVGRPTDGPDDDRRWLVIEPDLISCWDYGRLRADDGVA